MDRSARGDIRYQYTYQNKVYKSEEKDFWLYIDYLFLKTVMR